MDDQNHNSAPDQNHNLYGLDPLMDAVHTACAPVLPHIGGCRCPERHKHSGHNVLYLARS